MKPEYVLKINGQPSIASWSDLQLACECTQTTILALAQVNALANVTLERVQLNHQTVILVGCQITGSAWDVYAIRVCFEGKYSEVSA